ncbi:hypothetical protein CA267_011350 [Alteromonas pelagimontana]|uniref:Lipoprotein n=1 Tax=Alteromonas pelagimontana TaxID=1858656 RepID=A0A6M4MEM9_9ALTE|nr:hypothetical protein [Alteromonas pelagimontana]QJR81328.1 hypothetical protein CA267_011350 [Alteromonas pelagimontana]
MLRKCKLLKVGVMLAAMVLTVAACSPTSSSLDQLAINIATKNIQTPADTWFAHGSLHSETALAWQKASYQSKRATCADYLQAMIQKNMLKAQPFNTLQSIDELKPYAETLVQVLDKQLAVNGDLQQNEEKFSDVKIATQIEEAARKLGWLSETFE